MANDEDSKIVTDRINWVLGVSGGTFFTFLAVWDKLIQRNDILDIFLVYAIIFFWLSFFVSTITKFADLGLPFATDKNFVRKYNRVSAILYLLGLINGSIYFFSLFFR